VAVHPESRHLAPCGLDGHPDAHTDTAAEITDVLTQAAAAGVDRDDVALLGSFVLGGWKTAQLAERFAVTTRTVRNRRVRTTAALAALVAATAAVQ
jgi:hypothetical protein